MLNSIKKFFGFSDSAAPEVTQPTPSAPYKVPEPVAITPIPLVVEVPPVVDIVPAPKVTKPKAPAKPKTVAAPAAKPKKSKAVDK